MYIYIRYSSHTMCNIKHHPHQHSYRAIIIVCSYMTINESDWCCILCENSKCMYIYQKTPNKQQKIRCFYYKHHTPLCVHTMRNKRSHHMCIYPSIQAFPFRIPLFLLRRQQTRKWIQSQFCSHQFPSLVIELNPVVVYFYRCCYSCVWSWQSFAS